MAFMKAVIACLSLITTSVVGMKCPSSGSLIHAGVEVTAVADASCKRVRAEVQARISVTNGWTDPHNGGIYSLLSEADNELETQRTTNPKTAIGGKVYTDKQIFTFTDVADGKCQIEACSQSQGMSVYDASTNYCDIHDLYCNDAVCNPVDSFSTEETKVSPNFGSGGKDPKACLPKEATSFMTVARAASMKCPSSGSRIHAGVEVTAVADASCKRVKAEVQARISGANGWTDPHNSGIYSLLSEAENELKTQRTTNPKTSIGGKVYTDKQIFTFTDVDDGKCQIEACSQSQGMSISDASTNYCDIHDLYCNDAVCSPVDSFNTEETKVTPNFGSGGKDPMACLPKKEFETITV